MPSIYESKFILGYPMEVLETKNLEVEVLQWEGLGIYKIHVSDKDGDLFWFYSEESEITSHFMKFQDYDYVRCVRTANYDKENILPAYALGGTINFECKNNTENKQ